MKRYTIEHWLEKVPGTKGLDPATKTTITAKTLGSKRRFTLFNWVVSAAAINADNRFIICGINVSNEGRTLVATDGRALHSLEMDRMEDNEKKEVMVRPSEGKNPWQGLEDGTWIITRATQNEIDIARTEGNYPNYNQVIPDKKGLANGTFSLPKDPGHETRIVAVTGMILSSEYLRHALFDEADHSKARFGHFEAWWDPSFGFGKPNAHSRDAHPPIMIELSYGRTAVIMPIKI